MTPYYTIALTMGRTFIRSALIDEEGNILPNSFSIFSSKATESKEVIIQNIVKIIKFNINSILSPEFKINHIVFAVPSPFNFKDGKSYLKNQGQYDAIYGVDLKEILQKELENLPTVHSKLSHQFSLHFEHDARLFGLGEHILREPYRQNKRVLYLMLDKTPGATLLDHGKVMSLKETEGLEEMMPLTQSNNERTKEVYENILEGFVDILRPMIVDYSLKEIIVGGSFLLDYPRFSQHLNQQLEIENIQVVSSEFTPYYIFFGFSMLITKQLLE